MMTAVEALRSERAQLSEDERRWYATAWEELGENTRKTMTAAGPSSLDIPAHRMSPSVARLICTALLKLGWNAGAQLLSVPSPTIRNMIVPHHWVFQLNPTNAAYDEAGTLPESPGTILQ